jgi:two-component system chemotaxis response regulator CheB
MNDIKVLIVDDSAVIRNTLAKKLDTVPGLKVIGTAMDPFVARDKIIQLKPDVVTLDIEMPKMDGLTFLHKLMTHYPLPVVILSSLSTEGSETYFKALELGALEVLAKPDSAHGQAISTQISLLAEKIKSAARTNMSARRSLAKIIDKKEAAARQPSPLAKITDSIVAIGASTGGTQTFRAIFQNLPANCPPMAMVQHMPPMFTKSYAESLNNEHEIEVKEAEDGDHVRAGRLLIAPGNYHMTIERQGARFYAKLNQAPYIHHVRPAADVLFMSVAQNVGKSSVGVVLTGMGADGARGLKAMRDAGAATLVQDEASCIVYGMPKAAIDAGGADKGTQLNRIAHEIIKSCK